MLLLTVFLARARMRIERSTHHAASDIIDQSSTKSGETFRASVAGLDGRTHSANPVSDRTPPRKDPRLPPHVERVPASAFQADPAANAEREDPLPDGS